VTDLTIDQERETLLPKIERDQLELGAAIDELRTASAALGKRAAAVWISVGLLLYAGLLNHKAKGSRESPVTLRTRCLGPLDRSESVQG
jgi:hypothetical protein